MGYALGATFGLAIVIIIVLSAKLFNRNRTIAAQQEDARKQSERRNELASELAKLRREHEAANTSLTSTREELGALKVTAMRIVLATAKHLRRPAEIHGLHDLSGGTIHHEDRGFWDFYWRNDHGLVSSDQFRSFSENTRTDFIAGWLATAGSAIAAGLPKVWSALQVHQTNESRYENTLSVLITELAITSKALNAALQSDSPSARQDMFEARRNIDAALLLAVLKSTTTPDGYGWLDQQGLKNALRDHADPAALGDSIAKHAYAKARKDRLDDGHRVVLLDFTSEVGA